MGKVSEKADNRMTKLLYFALLTTCIAVASASVQAQNIEARNPRIAGTTGNALPSNASSIPLTIEPAAALGDFIRGFQGEARREPLTFKPIPGERNARVAEFTTPGGLRMRAYTSGPNSIRFTPADPSLDFGGININGPGIVRTMSAGAAAKTDAIHSVL